MINLIQQDGKIKQLFKSNIIFSQQLKSYPKSNLNIAIFGTQSTGKSTLVNSVFGSHFPVLNSKIQRKRCTKGVLLYNIQQQLNIIDTQGFDSVERKSQQKILQKQFALFCLILSDIILINLWMSEIGRYQGSHCNILKSIIKVSQRLISQQNTKKIIFVVKDCDQQADRTVLKHQLQANINIIIKQLQIQQKINQNSTNSTNSKLKLLKLNIQFHFMSHYYYKPQKYVQQAQQLNKIIKQKHRKSYLSNYSPTDRLVYMKELWQKIISEQNQIDLRSIQDALKSHTLNRIKNQTLQFIQKTINQTIQISKKYKSYKRFNQYVQKQAEYFLISQKPTHVRDKQLVKYIQQINHQIQYLINKQLIDKILPNEEQKLISQFSILLSLSSKSKDRGIQKILTNKRKQIIQIYKKIILQHKQSVLLLKKFTQKLSSISIKYQQQIHHNFNLFQIKLEKQLNLLIDKQINIKLFNLNQNSTQIQREISTQLNKKLKSLCKQFHYNQWEINFKEMWSKIINRTINQKLPQIIKQYSNKQMEKYHLLTTDRTNHIIAYHKKIEKKTQQFIINLFNSFQSQENNDFTLDTNPYIQSAFDKIKLLISDLITKGLQNQKKRFRLDSVIISVFMFIFYSEFIKILKFLITKRKKRNYLVNLYIFIGFLLLIASLYNKRKRIRQIFGINKQ